ncbi:RNA polymerase sigma-70 factor [Flavivirga amylovorans]|uniref:RNA polymerase sigma-70 factor n=1 Tax=Flavivirga amylovorans TaxID=870486 RepID=A0ABT8X4Z4_9FLAO|nr:RNA polymerase sigma-70 factor [Flavivirga amylovorans]MDO5988917.1 RNA polymerase sigma-70 factor [Flavivirga amylovorans]
MSKANKQTSFSIKPLSEINLKTYEKLYHSYYNKLCVYALKYTPDRSLIQDVVQDTFIDLWSNRKKVTITSSVKSYLYRMVYYKLMDAFKKASKKNNAYLEYYQSSIEVFSTTLESDDDYKNNLLIKLNECMEKLPKRCKTVFFAKKISGLKYSQISKQFNISIKTVEGHLRRGYVSLKSCMGDL